MKAGTKFALGAVLIIGSVGYLMAAGIKQTGQYFLTPSELAQRVSADPSFYDLGLKVGARVVPGTVIKETATQTLSFHVTDGTVLVGLWGGSAGLVGGARGRGDLQQSARHATFALCGALAFAVLCLEVAIFRHDFSLQYVASRTSRNLPTFYLWSALYSGQE